MKKLCNVKPKIKIQDYETTTIIMLSNMRIKFNKKSDGKPCSCSTPQQIFYLSIHRVLGVGFYDFLTVKGPLGTIFILRKGVLRTFST